MKRRDLLKLSAAGVAGTVAMSPEVASAAAAVLGTRPQAHLPEGTDLLPKIKHVVVVMMENQSFDSVLGTLTKPGTSIPRGDGLQWAKSTDGRPLNSNPTSLTPGAPRLRSFAMPTTAQMNEYPWQTWGATFTQAFGSPTATKLPTRAADWNQGFVVSNSGPIAMGYFTATQLPFFHSMAGTFPIADRWFASAPAQTYPNRMFMMAGTSLGWTTTSLPPVTLAAPNGTIFEKLDKHGITWKNYHCKDIYGASSLIWISQLLGPHADMKFAYGVETMDNFFADAAAGTLPSFSVVDPNFDQSSGENSQDLQHADAFMHDVVNAVMQGPGWKDTMLIWTFDEHGGYYDHVPPVKLGRPDSSVPVNTVWAGNPQLTSFDWSGMRVPSGVVSPYAKPDYVSSKIYDHTSILKLMCQKFNLPPFTLRDKMANSPLDMVDLSKAPYFLTPPTLAPKVTDAAGNPVSTGIGTDTSPTYDESVRFPNDNRTVSGLGKLGRNQFYLDSSDRPTNTTTPYWQAVQAAMNGA
jgi:phospholipase C